jgi:Reverse transcriptase (RNA-dependent DNA polymerase)
VADGHLTDVPKESVYSGVVSLHGIRLVLFLCKLNGMDLWATDISNTYLEAFTSDMVFIIAGPEFGDLEGHVFVISKPLCGLCSSGARWHDIFANMVLGFFPCKSDPIIWMRKNGYIYEYVAVYVDDLGIAIKDHQEFIYILETVHGFKTKNTGPISVHLGTDFFCDDDNTLSISPLKFIEKLIKTYKQMFGEPPKQVVSSPL